MRRALPLLLLGAFAFEIAIGQRFNLEGGVESIISGKLDENNIIMPGSEPKLVGGLPGFMVDAKFEELMEACVNGDLALVKKILSQRPHSINHRSVVMPIHAAVQHKRRNVVIWLIEHGANVNAKTEDGSTAVALAAYNGDLEMVKILIERGADPSSKNFQGYNALDIADTSGFPEIKEYISTPGRLQNAAKLGDLPTIQRMLTKKPWRVNEVRRYSAIHAAARFNHTEMLRFLIDQGANVDIQMFDASTPLILAASEGNKAIVEILVTNGADLNHVNYMGYDAVKAATATGHRDLAEFIGSYLEKTDPALDDDNDNESTEGSSGIESQPKEDETATAAAAAATTAKVPKNEL